VNHELNLTGVKLWHVLLLALGAAGAGVLIGMVIFGEPWHRSPDWGDAQTWILVALGAVGGGFTLRQLSMQREQLKEQQGVLAREAEDRRRAQARLVFLWTEVTTDSVLTQAQRAASGVTPNTIQVTHVRNTSRQPVYDFEVSWYDGASFHNSMTGNGVVMPDSGTDLKEELRAGQQRYRVTLSFRDAAGVRWHVDEDGNLKEA
jgi:hypothetical protein